MAVTGAPESRVAAEAKERVVEGRSAAEVEGGVGRIGAALG